MEGFFLHLSFLITSIAIANAILYLEGSVRNNRAFKFFAINLIGVTFINVVAQLIAKGYHENNLFLSHYYFIFQFILLSFFYKELLKSKLILILLVLLLIFIGYQYIDDPTIYNRYNSLGMSITQALLVLYSIIYFYRSLQQKSEFIIVNVGIFLYLLSSTLIFASGNLVLDLNISQETRFTLIHVNLILTFLFQILIFIEWFRNYRKTEAF